MSEAAMPAAQQFHDLYRDHRGWLESWLRRRMGNGSDAADLSQDTFLRVLASSQRIAAPIWRPSASGCSPTSTSVAASSKPTSMP